MNDLQASLTGTTIEQTDLGREKNIDLLQESEGENADADLTTNTSKIMKTMTT